MRSARSIPTLRVPRGERPFTRSVAGSFLVHVAILVTLIWGFGSDARNDLPGMPGPGPAGGGGGGGGARIQYVELPPYQPSTPRTAVSVPAAPSQPLVAPRPHVVPPPVQQPLELRQLEPQRVATVAGSGEGTGGGLGAGTGSGGGKGSGTGTGAGNATGPGTGGGSGAIFPPSPRLTILPPQHGVPGSLRGKSLQVHFWIDTLGVVERVVTDPEIEDRGFRARFLELMRSYKFSPATALDGTRVPAELTIGITLY